MAENLASLVKYLGHSHIAIKSIVTGEKGAQEGHFKAIEINQANDYITLRNGKRQLWVNLQKLKPEIGKYISFNDIDSYKNVYIDLDCEKPDGMKDYAATEAERAKALSYLPRLRTWLESHSLRCGLELHTGNGAGMVLPIPETNAEPVFIAKLATFLKKLQADIPCTDPAMFDPPRVIGIPGTINAKLETEDRKNQVREIVGDIPARAEDQALLDLINSMGPDPAALKEWSAKYGEYQAPPKVDNGTVDADDIIDRLTGILSADPKLNSLLGPHDDTKYKSRSDQEYGACGKLVQYGFVDAEIDFIMCHVSKIGKWTEEGPHYRFDRTLRKLREAEASNDTGRRADAGHKESQLKDALQSLDFEELTEGGNASRLERICGDCMRYCHTFKKWYLWNKGRWQQDDDGGANRIASNVVGALYIAAGQADGKDDRDRIARFAKETDSRKGIANMLALASSRLAFATTANKLDRDPWLLGAEDVTFDLKTGGTREPRREDLITKAIGAKYDRSAQCPLWNKFIDRIFAGDKELISYIKRAFGYCLTGSMAEQVFFFCHGDGSNGKSVFLAVLRALLGEYAKQADFSTFLVQRNEKVRNDLAALAGARVITAIEAEEGSKLSMAVVKAWTGGDPITARFLFGENFTFQPVGKLWLAANSKPAISERNHAAWRRVQLIPFNVTIPEAEQDKGIEDKLLRELPGILNWALEGLKDYLTVGLKTPEAVKLATAKYRKENDSLEEFLFECCEVEKLKVCKNTDLYSQYLNFCRMSGLTALSQHKFSPELSSRPDITSTRSKHGMEWTGIALKKDWCSFEDKATPQSRGPKGVALEQNAQSIQYSALREDFAQNALKATPHNDCKATPTPKYPVEEEKGRKDPGLQKFKAGMAKHKCCLCGRTFPYDLTPYYNNGVSGYICVTCHMNGKPPEPAKIDSQAKLEAGA